jgi:hypothetical protein
MRVPRDIRLSAALASAALDRHLFHANSPLPVTTIDHHGRVTRPVIGVLENRLEHDAVRSLDYDETPKLLHLPTVGEPIGSLQEIERALLPVARCFGRRRGRSRRDWYQRRGRRGRGRARPWTSWRPPRREHEPLSAGDLYAGPGRRSRGGRVLGRRDVVGGDDPAAAAGRESPFSRQGSDPCATRRHDSDTIARQAALETGLRGQAGGTRLAPYSASEEVPT